MPSGHMTHTTIFAVVMILGRYMSSSGKKFNLENILFYGINVALVIVMAFARYYKKCHNIPQIFLDCLRIRFRYPIFYLMKTFFVKKKSDVLGSEKFLNFYSKV